MKLTWNHDYASGKASGIGRGNEGGRGNWPPGGVPRREIMSNRTGIGIDREWRGEVLSAEMLDGIFEGLDQWSLSSGGLRGEERRGPFSVFGVELQSSGERSQGIGGETIVSGDGVQVGGLDTEEDGIADEISQPPVPATESSTVSTKTTTPDLAYRDESPSDTEYNIERPITSTALLETELIHHWVIFLSQNMLLIDTPDNPCRTVFMPLALQGLDTSSPAHLAVFHTICAASAFSLSYLCNDARYHSSAVRHDQHALYLLRQHLLRGGRLDEPTLAAALTCITGEAMSGRKGRWRAHVVGVLGLLEREISRSWIRSPTATPLIQSCLSLSTLCRLRVPQELAALFRGVGPQERDCYLERAHGVTRGLVEFLADVNDIKAARSHVSSVELDQLELRLYLNFPRASTSTHKLEVVQHALNSFYYATVIYFRRTLRRACVADVRDLVEKAVHDLEAVEAEGSACGSAYNWASFVVAAECDQPELQARMLNCFDRKRRHGIKNIDQLREFVRIVWERRVFTGLDLHWQDLADEFEFDIMFV